MTLFKVDVLRATVNQGAVIEQLDTAIFRACDVRGRVPDQIDEAVAFAVGRILGGWHPHAKVGVGRDTRVSSAALAEALMAGFIASGCETFDLGLCPTEVVAFGVGIDRINLGVMVTASHHPEPNNGFKLFKGQDDKESIAQLLGRLKTAMLENFKGQSSLNAKPPKALPLIDSFVEYLVQPLRVDWAAGPLALNGLNGTASLVAGPLAARLNLEVLWVRGEQVGLPIDGPDPLKPLLAAEMSEFVSLSNASLGTAWDGDADRCVFFDEKGALLPNAYVMAMMTDHFLKGSEGRGVVYDPKLVLNIQKSIARHQGHGVRVATGSAHMRAAMHQTGAVYGGESSAHHYFGCLGGIDSGMLAWITMLEMIAKSGQSVSKLTERYRTEVAVLPEMSLKIDDPAAMMLDLDQVLLKDGGCREAGSDGETFGAETHRAYRWPSGVRFSLNPSTTEDIMRFNFESEGDPKQMLEQSGEVLELLLQHTSSDQESVPRLSLA